MKTKLRAIALSLLSLLALTTACSEDEFSVYGDSLNDSGDFSSFKWYTGGTRETSRTSEKEINLGTYIGFYDLSHNAISHKWTIPSSTKFLNKEFSNTDSIYTKFIVPSDLKESTEDLINVYFPEAGIQEIKLTNTFKDSVTDAVFVEGAWVVDKTFTIDVFENPNPEGKVYRQNFIPNPEDPTGPTIEDLENPYSEVLTITATDSPLESEMDSWAEISIEAGEKLKFENLSTIGRVDGVKWYVEGGKPETSGNPAAEITYNKLGTYTAWFESKRTADVGPVKSVSKLIPLKINVIKSSKPFKFFGGLSIDGDQIISFSVTGEVVGVENQLDKFKAHVVNAGSSFDGDISVTSVEVDRNDATIIHLKLADPVYNSDVLTISYEGGSTEEDRVSSVDDRYLSDFEGKVVKMHYQGVMNLKFTGYEESYVSGNLYKNANTFGYFAQHNAKNEAGPNYYWRDTEVQYEGNSSMKFETPATGIPNLARLQGSKFAEKSPVSAGRYIPSVWVFLEEGNTMTNVQYNFTDGPVLDFDLTDIPREKWTQLRLPEMDFPTIDSGRFDINVTNTGQDDAIVQKLWLDNFDLLQIELRP